MFWNVCTVRAIRSDFQCGCWGLEVMNWTLPQTKTQPQEIAKDLLNADMFRINLGLSMWANLRGEFLCHWGICPSHFLEALYLQRVGAPPHFLEEFGLGACALRLLVPLIKSCCFLLNIFELAFVVKEYEWLWTSFNTGFFNQPQSCSWILLVICLVRWWGWFMLVPACGFPLMPYHFLEILETVKYHANTKRDPQREHTGSLEGKHTGRNTVLRKDV